MALWQTSKKTLKVIDVVWGKGFTKSYRECIRSSGTLKVSFWETISLFGENPFHPVLRTHRLTGRLAGLWAFSVDEDCRVVFSFKDNGKAALLVDIGSHEEVY